MNAIARAIYHLVFNLESISFVGCPVGPVIKHGIVLVIEFDDASLPINEDGCLGSFNAGMLLLKT
jgi:hypothetical protein